MSKRIPLLAALGLTAALSPTFAAEVYVPLASQQKADGLIYRTEVVVSNPGEETRTFSSTLLTADTDRAASPVSVPRSIPAGGTFVLRQTVAKQGMLTISGLDELVVTARVDALRGGLVVSSAPAPVVTRGNLLPAGATAHVQGLGRGAVLGLVNTSAEAAQCWATAVRADGTQAGEARLTAPPRSARLWSRALAGLGSSFSEARAEVTCDAPFYAYAMVTGPAGATSFLSPSGSLSPDQDEMDAVNEEARAVATCLPGDAVTEGLPDGAEGFHIPGEFLQVRAQDLCRAYDVPLEMNVAYRRITMEFDVFIDRWRTPLFHNMTALRRSGRTRNERVLFAGVFLRGDNKKTTLDLGRESMVKAVGPWQTDATYHIVIQTDVPSRRVTLSVFRGEELVQQMGGRMTTREIRSVPGKQVKVDFSSPAVGDGAYFPPTGWRFSNLTVRAER